MNQILYDNRCRCKEEISITKKRTSRKQNEGKALAYPTSEEVTSKIFQMKSHQKLSLTAKFLLNSFQNKYLYYAIDDILDTFKVSPVERKTLLAILYSPVLSLHNNCSVNFFDIWIRQVSIQEISKPNKFLTPESQNLTDFTYITIQFFYKTKVAPTKRKSLW